MPIRERADVQRSQYKEELIRRGADTQRPIRRGRYAEEPITGRADTKKSWYAEEPIQLKSWYAKELICTRYAEEPIRRTDTKKRRRWYAEESIQRADTQRSWYAHGTRKSWYAEEPIRRRGADTARKSWYTKGVCNWRCYYFLGCIPNSTRDSVSIFTKVRFAKPRKRKLVNNFLKTTFGKSAAKQTLNLYDGSPTAETSLRQFEQWAIDTGILFRYLSSPCWNRNVPLSE